MFNNSPSPAQIISVTRRVFEISAACFIKGSAFLPISAIRLAKTEMYAGYF